MHAVQELSTTDKILMKLLLTVVSQAVMHLSLFQKAI